MYRVLNWNDEMPNCDWITVTEGGSQVWAPYLSGRIEAAGDPIIAQWNRPHVFFGGGKIMLCTYLALFFIFRLLAFLRFLALGAASFVQTRIRMVAISSSDILRLMPY